MTDGEIGDWEERQCTFSYFPRSVWIRTQVRNGAVCPAWLAEDNDSRAVVDELLVQEGLLPEERAFKMAEVVPFRPGHMIRIKRPVYGNSGLAPGDYARRNAPREARDGFNLERGPNWDAWLCACADVQEDPELRAASNETIMSRAMAHFAKRREGAGLKGGLK